MNRNQRRQAEKTMSKESRKQAKQKFTLLELQKAMSIASEMVKQTGGHLYSVQLKERCVFCGKGRRTKMDCKFWFTTFLDRLQTILINPTFFRADEIQAEWIQHGEEYQGIQIPVLLQ